MVCQYDGRGSVCLLVTANELASSQNREIAIDVRKSIYDKKRDNPSELRGWLQKLCKYSMGGRPFIITEVREIYAIQLQPTK